MNNINNFSQILKLLKSPSEEPLDSRIKASYTIGLWSDRLVERSSLLGRATDMARRWSPWPLPAVTEERWHSIFCKALAAKNSKQVKALPLEQKHLFHTFQYNYTKKPKVQIGIKNAEKTTHQALHWTDDPKALRKLSLLRKKQPDSQLAIDASFLETLYGLNPANLSCNAESIDKISGHITSYLKKHNPKIAQEIKSLIRKGLRTDRALQKTINLGRKSDSRSKAHKRLKFLAKDTSHKICQLKPGQSRLIFGGTPASAPHLKLNFGQDNPTFNHFLDFLNQPPSPQTLEKVIDYILDQLSKNPQSSQLEKLQNHLQKGLLATLFPKIKDSLLSNQQTIGQNLLLAIPELFRLGADRTLSSLESQLIANCMESFSQTATQAFADEIRDAIINKKDLHPILRRHLLEPANNSIESLHKSLLGNIHQITTMLPPQACEIISQMGYGDLGAPEANLWLEISREIDGKFTLYVYATGSAASLQGVVPLVYKNLTAEQLDLDFFWRFYSYKAWPQWDPSIRYSVKDIHKGLLGSLPVPPSAPEGVLKSLEQELSSTQAPWGLIRGLVDAHIKFRSKEERAYFFYSWRKEALISFWQQQDVKNNKTSLQAKDQEIICQAADALANEALALYEAEDLDLDELKSIYATTWEIQESLKSQQEPLSPRNQEKRPLLPDELAKQVRSLFESLDFEKAALAKQLLKDNLGEGIETALNDILADISPASLPEEATKKLVLALPPRPALSERGIKLINAAMNGTFGVNFKDFIAPSFFSYVKIAVFSSRLALSILFPTFAFSIHATWVITFLAKGALEELSHSYYFHQIQDWDGQHLGLMRSYQSIQRKLYEWKLRLLTKTAGQVLLTKNQRQTLEHLIIKWQALATRNGELSFELEALSPPKPTFKLRRLNFKLASEVPSPLKAQPIKALKKLKKITAGNCLQSLDGYLQELKTLSQSPLLTLRCNQILASLPMPLPAGQKDVWSETTDFKDCLEKMVDLALELYNSFKQDHPYEQKHQAAVHLYKAYAIIDKLARRDADAGLDGYNVNPWGLAQIKDNAFFRIIDPRVKEELAQICHYFGIDPQKNYTPDEIIAKKGSSLFVNAIDFNIGGTSLKVPGFIHPDFEFTNKIAPLEQKYLEKLLTRPDIQNKLQHAGLDASASLVEQLTLLHTEKKPLSDPEIKRHRKCYLLPQSPKFDLLPRSFFLLRQANLLANDYLSSLQRGNDGPNFPLSKEDSHSGYSIGIDNRTLEFLSVLPVFGPYLKKENRPDLLKRWMPINYSIIRKESCRIENAAGHRLASIKRPSEHALNFCHCSAKPPNGLYSSRINFIDIFNNFLHTAHRKQNEIINQTASFAERRGIKKGFFNFFEENETLENYLSELPENKRTAIETIWADPDDQAVRTLAYFSEHKEDLCRLECRLLFALLLLKGDALERQLKADPHFGQTLGKFFDDNLRFLPSFDFIEIAIFCAEKIKMLKGQPERSFPDFSSLLMNCINQNEEYERYEEYEAAKLLMSMHYFEDPSSMSLKERAKACFDICFASFVNNNKVTPNDMGKETLYKWLPEIFNLLNRHENTRNKILNALAIKKGMLPAGTKSKWGGSYPHFVSGPLHLTLDLQNNKVFFENGVSQTGIVEDQIIAFLTSQGIADPKLDFKNGNYLVKNHPITIEYSPSNNSSQFQYKIRMTHQGQSYKLVNYDNLAASTGCSHWLSVQATESSHRLLTYQQGQVIKTSSVEKRSSGVYAELSVEEVPIDLEKEKHHLHLLAWFQPLSAIKAFRGPSRQLSHFIFTKLGLEFKIHDAGGRKAAVCDQIPGYKISEKQKQTDLIPTLKKHTQYLLLDNPQGLKKVIIPASNLHSAFASYLIKLGTGISTSHYADLQLSNMLGNLAPNKSYYIYSVDANGKLTSDEPEALMHLLLNSLAAGDFSEAYYYLHLIEAYGKRLPYSEKICDSIKQLEMAALLVNDPLLRRMALRLAAIREENSLVQNPSKAPPSSTQETFLSWLLLQANYFQHLKEKKCYPYLPLDEYQELFILQTIARKSEQLLVNNFNLDSIDPQNNKSHLETLKAWIKPIGHQTLAESLLMLPPLSERLTFLQNKYSLPGGKPAWKLMDLTKKLIQKQINTLTDGPLPSNTAASKAAKSQTPSKASACSVGMQKGFFDILLSLLPNKEALLKKSLTHLDFIYLIQKEKYHSFYESASKALKAKASPDGFPTFEKTLLDFKENYPIYEPFFSFVISNPQYLHLLPPPDKLETMTQDSFYEAIHASQAKMFLHDLETGWANVPVHFSQLNFEDMRLHFLTYYQLATGKMPAACENDSQKRKLFLKRSKEFKKHLKIAKGQSESEQVIVEVLQLAANRSLLEGFPDPQTYIQNLKTLIENYEEIEKNRLLKGYVDIPDVHNFYDTKRNLNSLLPAMESARIKALTFSKTSLNAAFSAAKSQAPLLATGAASSLLPLLTDWSLPWPLTYGYYAYKGYQGIEYLRKTLNEIDSTSKVALEERKKQDFKNLRQEAALPETWLDGMQREDSKLAHFSQQLLKRYFKPVKKVTTNAKGSGNFKSPSDSPMAKKSFTKLNHSVHEFYARQPADQLPDAFAHFESYYQLKGTLEQAREQLQVLLGRNKAKILKGYKSHPPRNKYTKAVFDRETIAKKIKKAPSEKKKPSLDPETRFDLILKAFIQDDEQALLELTDSDAGKLPQLKRQIYHYLTKAIRCQQIERACEIHKKIDPTKLDEPATKTHIKQLAFELGRKRAYAFKGLPTRLLRGYMAFEYGTKTMLWEKQVAQLQKMLLERNERSVLELIMGSGKTFFGTPMASFFSSNGEEVIFNCFPDSLASENIKDLSARSQKVFAQTANAFKISRQSSLHADQLWALLKVHTRALDHKEHLNSCKNDLQALELCFIEEAALAVDKAEGRDDTVLKYFMQLLQFIRTKARGNIDEAHRLFRYNDELNHPLGAKKKVKQSYINVISECMRILVATPEIKKAIQLASNDQTLCSIKKYHQEILPRLAEELCSYQPFDIQPKQKQLFISYLCGQTAEIPDFILTHSRKSEIAMARGVLLKLLPEALEKKVDVHFGTKGNEYGYAQPYHAKDSPIEGSTFKNPHEAVLKTLMAAIHVPLTQPQVEKLVTKLKNMAEMEANRNHIHIHETRPAKLLAQWTKNKFSINGQIDYAKLTKLLNQGYAPRMTYARLFAIPEITYFAENLRSDSQNFASMFASFYAGTASPNNEETFPTGTKVLWDNGTAGEFVDHLYNKCPQDQIFEIASRKPKEALDDILKKLFAKGSKMTALIDCGALLYGLSNETVADATLKFIKEERPDLQAVVYFNESNELVIKEPGKKAIPLASSSIPPEKRITYYDQSHTFGADIPQAIGAGGALTINEKTNFEELMQGGGRMRGLKTSMQSLAIVVNNAVRKLISQDKPLEIDDVIAFTRKNEAEQQEKSAFPSVQQQMANIIRRAILDKMIASASVEEMLKYMKKYRSLLISKAEDDPFNLYGQVELDLHTEDAIKQLRAQHFGIIERCSLFSKEDKQKVLSQLSEIGQKATLPETVQLAVNNGKLDMKLTDLGKAQHVALNLQAEQDQEATHNQELQQQQNMNLELNMQSDSDNSRRRPGLRLTPAKWDSGIDYFSSLDWFKPAKEAASKHAAAEIYSVADSLSNNATLSTVKNAFKGNLFWTNNLRGILQDSQLEAPAGRYQKPIYELLIMQDSSKGKDAPILSCAVDQADASFWRDRFASSRENGTSGPIKIALFDLSLNTIVDQGVNVFDHKRLATDETFNFDLARWRFLGGRVSLQKEKTDKGRRSIIARFKDWILEHNADEMRNAYSQFYHSKGTAQFNHSPMQSYLSIHEDEVFKELL